MTWIANPAYDASTGADRTSEINPLSQHFVSETLADITDGADGTYYYYVDMDGFRKGNFQLILSGGSGTCTVTVEGTIQADGTPPASCAYEDITNGTFGAVSFTASVRCGSLL